MVCSLSAQRLFNETSFKLKPDRVWVSPQNSPAPLSSPTGLSSSIHGTQNNIFTGASPPTRPKSRISNRGAYWAPCERTWLSPPAVMDVHVYPSVYCKCAIYWGAVYINYRNMHRKNFPSIFNPPSQLNYDYNVAKQASDGAVKTVDTASLHYSAENRAQCRAHITIFPLPP